MTLDDIRAHCLALPGTTEDSPWDGHFAYKIGGKMYLITSTTNPVSMSIKCSEDDFNELIEREGIKPAPYLAKHKWVQLERANVVNARELKTLLTKSYEIIKAKLPKKLLAEIRS